MLEKSGFINREQKINCQYNVSRQQQFYLYLGIAKDGQRQASHPSMICRRALGDFFFLINTFRQAHQAHSTEHLSSLVSIQGSVTPGARSGVGSLLIVCAPWIGFKRIRTGQSSGKFYFSCSVTEHKENVFDFSLCAVLKER